MGSSADLHDKAAIPRGVLSLDDAVCLQPCVDEIDDAVGLHTTARHLPTESHRATNCTSNMTVFRFDDSQNALGPTDAWNYGALSFIFPTNTKLRNFGLMGNNEHFLFLLILHIHFDCW